MPNFNGIRNVRGAEFNPDRIKSYLTARAGQLSKTAQPVATTSAAKPVELSALAQAWMHTWSLPEMDPSSVKWVGVNPSDFYGQPGRARLAVMEQKTGLGALATDYFFRSGGKPTTEPLQPQIGESAIDTLSLSAVVAQGGLMGSLPLPLLSGGHEPLSQSVMQAYPINQYGYANRSVPTQRVKTLIDLLGEKDVWPEQYKKLIPLLPVYHFTAFVPRPIQPEDFVADYSFQVSASRPMIVHRVIQDRLIPGYVYNPADRVSLLSTFELQIDDIAVDEARKASHCLFRAQDSLGLIDASNDGIDSVSGRVVLVVMQQPQPKMEFRAIDPWNTNSPLMRGGPTLGASISGTSIGMGDRLAPVRIGDGASIDPERLPAIISIRVLGVRQTDQISNQLLDVAGSIRQFK